MQVIKPSPALFSGLTPFHKHYSIPSQPDINSRTFAANFHDMVKGSKLYSIAHMKCPRCQEGDIFVYRNTYNLKKTGIMHRHCPVCGLNYTPEPGFYFGAGYVSYAMSVGVAIAIFAALFPFLHWDHFEIYIGVIAGTLLLAAPLFFRLSRVIWLNFFNSYQGVKK
jgi:uncharacterized protein (DUF983 family)